MNAVDIWDVDVGSKMSTDLPVLRFEYAFGGQQMRYANLILMDLYSVYRVVGWWFWFYFL